MVVTSLFVGETYSAVAYGLPELDIHQDDDDDDALMCA